MNRKLIVTAVAVLFAICLGACGELTTIDGAVPEVPGDGGSNSLMLSWTAPTTNEDGSPLEDLAGYRIYYGNESGNYFYVAEIGNSTAAKLSNLSDKSWYVVVTAYDFFGNESSFSNEINYTFY